MSQIFSLSRMDAAVCAAARAIQFAITAGRQKIGDQLQQSGSWLWNFVSANTVAMPSWACWSSRNAKRRGTFPSLKPESSDHEAILRELVDRFIEEAGFSRRSANQQSRRKKETKKISSNNSLMQTRSLCLQWHTSGKRVSAVSFLIPAVLGVLQPSLRPTR